MFIKELSPQTLSHIGKILRAGGLAAMPTETVYGLAANAFDERAVRRIYEVKGRPGDNPMIVHIADITQLDGLFSETDDKIKELARRFWPGPLTIIAPRADNVPDAVTGGLDTVAVRMPSHPAALAMIRAAGVPLAAPSANPSGRPSPTSAAHVMADIGEKIDVIVDGGDCEIGVESTIIDLSVSPAKLLRPGGVPVGALREVLGEIVTDKAVYQKLGEGETARAPGMKYRHYAPDAPLTAVFGPPEKTAEYIKKTAKKNDAVICFNGFAGLFTPLPCVCYGAAENPEAQARGLYSALRDADTFNAGHIYLQCVKSGGIGGAVENRITKAAGYDVVEL